MNGDYIYIIYTTSLHLIYLSIEKTNILCTWIIIDTEKSCGSPGEIEGATMVGSYLYGDEVTYICRHNYIMAEGNDTLRCQEDQTWSGARPRCALRKPKLIGKSN